MIDHAQQLQPDSAAIAIVASSAEGGLWSVQVAGRLQSILCRSLTGDHRPGDSVIVLLEPHESVPVILGPSPWRVASTIAPGQIYWPGITPHDTALDIVDAVAAAALVQDVAANYLARHQRGHSLLSMDDHSDVEGTAAGDNVLIYSSGKWRPQPAPTPVVQTRWTRRLMMMGM